MLIHSCLIEDIAEPSEQTNLFLTAELKSESGQLTRRIIYLAPVKQLTLPAADITLTVKPKAGCYAITLSSAVLVKNLYLYTELSDGFFSDNYFDLLPGKEVTVDYRVTVSTNNIAQDIKYMALNRLLTG